MSENLIKGIKGIIKTHKICVVMPTYNNAGTLRSVLSDILRYTSDVIVVNDGSTDSTLEILKEFGSRIELVTYTKNRGKGYALKKGMKYARELGYKYAITIDSDGQHYADDIPSFVRAIAENPESIIIGERDLSNVDINQKSSFANKFSNFWFRLQTGVNLKDTQTGFRSYPLDKLNFINFITFRYEAELELLVFASWHGVEINPIPIKVYYPPQSERISHFKPAKDFTRISILNTLLCGLAIIYGLPCRIINNIRYKKIFNRECKFFTRHKDKKRDAAITWSRIFRSIYGFSIFGFCSVFILTPFVGLVSLLGKNSPRKKRIVHKTLQWGSKIIVNGFPGARVVYENFRGEEFDKPALIICNHQSHLDLPVLIAMNPKLIFLTNDWVWNSAVFGKLIHAADFLPVSQGVDVIIPKLKELIAEGYSIVVFPEGTRSPDCKILRFHQGAFHIAEELSLDILPFLIHGAGHYLPKKSFLFRRGEITVKMLDRVHFAKDEDMPLRKVASDFRRVLKNEYSKLADLKEKTEYYVSWVYYKYAYRGWKTLSLCKKELKKIKIFSDMIDAEPEEVRNVQILKSGIGVFPLLYALVNKDKEVYAFEEEKELYQIACQTSGLPGNLHFIHSVFPTEYRLPDVKFDKTIILEVEDNSPSLIPYIESSHNLSYLKN